MGSAKGSSRWRVNRPTEVVLNDTIILHSNPVEDAVAFYQLENERLHRHALAQQQKLRAASKMMLRIKINHEKEVNSVLAAYEKRLTSERKATEASVAQAKDDALKKIESQITEEKAKLEQELNKIHHREIQALRAELEGLQTQVKNEEEKQRRLQSDLNRLERMLQIEQVTANSAMHLEFWLLALYDTTKQERNKALHSDAVTSNTRAEEYTVQHEHEHQKEENTAAADRSDLHASTAPRSRRRSATHRSSRRGTSE